MKLRTKFILFIVIIHLITVALTFFIFRENKLLFIIAELAILLSIVIAWQLYKQLIQPIQLLIQGVEAIKDGDFNVKFTGTGQYEMDELIQVYNQMADALRTERTKQQQQFIFLEKLIDTSPTGIVILNFDENIHAINPRALKLLEMEEKDLVGKAIDDVKHPLLQPIKQLRSGEATSITLNGVNTYKLQKSHFIDRGFARHFVMIEELTTEILAAEKKGYEKVIRMMAHEVNNTIGPVNSILQSTLTADKIWIEGHNQALQDALQVAFERNQNLSIFMRNFSEIVRLPKPKRATIDLHQLISSLAPFIEMMAREKEIQFVYELEKGPFFIHADKQQMEQVLINIVKNSIEAIAEKGAIRFTTHLASRQFLVTDNGKGIAEADADQLFSPFFSTKKDGQGIGLTLVKEILINHGYEFSLQTPAPGHTSFVFRFGELTTTSSSAGISTH